MALDKYLDSDDKEVLELLDNEKSMLNSNGISLGIIVIPKTWIHERGTIQTEKTINHVLINNCILQYDLKAGIVPQFHLCTEIARKLRIALIEPDRNLDLQVIREGVKHATVKLSEGEEERITPTIQEAFELAYNKKCNIILYPELFGGDKIDEMLSIEVAKHQGKYLLFTPSYYYMDTLNGKFYNALNTYRGSDGDFICMTTKKNGAEFYYRDQKNGKTVQLEEKFSRTPNIHLFITKDMGIFAILICADALTEYLIQFMKAMKIRVLFIVSYSPGMRDFVSNLSGMNQEHATIVYLNSCKAIGENIDEKPICWIVHSEGKDIQEVQLKCPNRCETRKDCKEIMSIEEKGIEVKSYSVGNGCMMVVEMEMSQ